MVNPHPGLRGDDGLGMQRHTGSGQLDHAQIVRAAADEELANAKTAKDTADAEGSGRAGR